MNNMKKFKFELKEHELKVNAFYDRVQEEMEEHEFEMHRIYKRFEAMSKAQDTTDRVFISIILISFSFLIILSMFLIKST